MIESENLLSKSKYMHVRSIKPLMIALPGMPTKWCQSWGCFTV